MPTTKKVEEELLADITGDALSDPKFLSQLAANMEDQEKRNLERACLLAIRL